MPNPNARRILIVEDNLLIAEHMATIIGEAGFVALGPVATNDEARAFIDNPAHAFDAVLLDVQLDRSSLIIADQLRRMDVPFVFATGNRGDIPPEYSGHPVCEKPFNPWRLVQALNRLFETEEQDAPR
jgi:DNA-binding response OmpR family regulator